MAGYALTRLNFLGGPAWRACSIYAYLAPGTILFIPLYVMMNSLGLRDSLGGAGAGPSDVLGAVRHLAADGLLQDDPDRA